MEKIFTSKKILITVIIAVIVTIIATIGIWSFCNMLENKRLDKTSVVLKDDLAVSFGKEVKVSDFLADLQGKIVDDYTIDTHTLGEKTVAFDYVNIKNKKRTANFQIKVVDDTAPTIYGSDTYTLGTNYGGDLTNLMLSGDDLDNNPKREIIGTYDLAKPGKYNLEYKVTDNYNNSAGKKFTLNIVEPKNNEEEIFSMPKMPIQEVINQHKSADTKIGIDVSSWQGEIDWKKVKAAGVEFAMVRVGYQIDFDGEYILDKFYERNIKAAEEVGLPVGVYFYSYANTVDEAQKQAEWIIEQLKNYKVELGIAFDWESWADFNRAKMSFYTINRVAQTFLDVAARHGYRGWLYSSKVYLDRIWQPTNHDVWLAQYYYRVTYDGEYAMWQLSNTGQVDGIDGDVDLDIWYLGD